MSIVLDGTSGLTSPAAVLTTTPLAVTSGGTGVTTSTGTGAVVLGTSPTLTTPIINTLNTSSGVLATQNGMTGIAKAWVNYSATTQTILSSFNVSSVTYSGTGSYVVNITTALTTNYAMALACGGGIGGLGYPLIWNGSGNTTTSASIRIVDSSTNNINCGAVYAAFYCS